ncbi:MAG: bifunctional 2-methylcitrate dehydratase/aconitate hydratase [Gammaproteobacteria bacterium]
MNTVAPTTYTLADPLLRDITDYVVDYRNESELARQTASYCLMDALGCAIAALDSTECRRRLGPAVPGAVLPGGVRVPGTSFELDPVRATFNLGCMVRWLDYNDTWLAQEWGHPSDNLCAILCCADYISRKQNPALAMGEVLQGLIKAYEIQGVLSLENSFNGMGLDHVILVRVASCAVTAALLGGSRAQIVNALSNAWLDGGALRTYRHGSNTGWRKSWAAGDAAARGVQHALAALNGEMGCPTVLSAPRWGFEDVFLSGRPLRISRSLQSYVMENILFKLASPVEFHAQTAVECALQLHKAVVPRLHQIEHIVLATQESALRIIDKKGSLRNPADRDHCLQYAVAVALIFGELSSRHYEDETARDARIDRLRDKMEVVEDAAYSRDYLDPDKRAIGNRLTIHFSSGETVQCAIDYPLGHPRRRKEALPLLMDKFRTNLAGRFPRHWIDNMVQLLTDPVRLEQLPVLQFMNLWVGRAE